MSAHPLPPHWGPQGRYYHRTTRGAYGLSKPGETLDAYKQRVRNAYGDLRGVTFHDAESAPPADHETL